MISIKAHDEKVELETDGTLEEVIEESLNVIDSVFKSIVPNFKEKGIIGGIYELAFWKSVNCIMGDNMISNREMANSVKIDPDFAKFMKGLEDNDR